MARYSAICVYCDDRKNPHHIADCPHLKQHLLSPDPRFNGIRSFMGTIEQKIGVVVKIE